MSGPARPREGGARQARHACAPTAEGRALSATCSGAAQVPRRAAPPATPPPARPRLQPAGAARYPLRPVIGARKPRGARPNATPDLKPPAPRQG
jgi:hypothetical protein